MTDDTPDAAEHACPTCGRRYDPGTVFCPHDGARIESRARLVGTLFDDLYEVEAEIGAGGMGVVYRARHALLKDVVALKVMTRASHAGPDAYRRFLLEGQAARRFRHPNAVAVHDLRVARDGTPYLVLEYVAGRTLRHEMLREGRLSAERALEIVAQIASALDAAHAAGVVHRDLKPENVMLAGEPRGPFVVKVLDLGVAKILEDADADAVDRTHAGSIVGTPLYMSPEQWGAPSRDGGPDVDGRADVYGLGVMTFELVVGALPFDGRSVSELRRHHLRTAPPPAGGAAPDLPRGFEAAITRALAKDRADRQKSAGAFARELAASFDALTSSLRATSDTLDVADDDLAGPLAGVPNNVPWPITSFVGRERELAEARDLLGRSRLVTLAGPGGIGKTRLALELAAATGAAHPDGVWFVELGSVVEPELVAGCVAEALGGETARAADPLAAIRERLSRGRALLVLDNCEQVVDAAASLAAALLRACPGLRAIATSRVPLGVAGETVWRVPPLSLPGEGGPASEAVLLFAERARAANPTFRLDAESAPLVAELCRRLDGMPLALELAAGSTRMFAVARILERLERHFDIENVATRGVPERQRSLRGAIEWGHAMLAEDERALLRRLSVFAGGWDLEAAEAVAGAGLADGRTLSLLMRLVDASFVVADAGDGRYRMLQTIRRYAEQRLGESGEEAEVVARYRAWFVELAKRCGREANGANEQVWLERLAAEHDNVRAVLADPGRAPADALELCVALERFWSVRGFWNEGRRTFARALEAAEGADVPAALRAAALNKAGSLELNVEEPERAVALYERAVALRREIGDRAKIANSLHNLAIAVRQAGDHERAEALYAESLALYREIGDERGEAVSLTSLGALAVDRGLYSHARRLYEDCLVVFRRIGDRRMIGLLQGNIGEIAWLERDLDAAVRPLEDALAIARALGFKALAAHSYEVLGKVALARRELARAGELFASALAIQRTLGSKSGIASVLESFACLAASGGEAERAVGIAAVAASLRTTGGKASAPIDSERAALAHYVEPARQTLDPDARALVESRAVAAGPDATIDDLLADH